MEGFFDALIKTYIVQMILVILVFLMAFIQRKFKFKNKSLNFIKESDNVLNIMFSWSYLSIFCIPFVGYVAFSLAIWELFFNLRGAFEKEHTEYLLNVIKSIYDKEEDINRQYKKEFELIESILSDIKNPYHEMVVENAIVLDSFLNEYNKIKEYFKTEEEDIEMYNEIKISLINFLKCIYNMNSDSKREMALDEKEILLKDIEKYNKMLKEYTKL